jgi:two-component system sensor histidine kinase DctS
MDDDRMSVDAAPPAALSPRLALRAGLRRALPAFIALLLAAATAVLFALSSTQERSEAAQQVTSDTLLARESIAFQFGRESEALQKLAADIGRGALPPDALQARLQAFLRRAGHVLGVYVLDAHHRPTMSVERPDAERLDALAPRLFEAAAARAQVSQLAVATPAFMGTGGAAIAVVVPIQGAQQAFVVAVYSLQRLLEEMVPWSLAQDYEFGLADVTGTLHARRVAVRPGRGLYRHQEPLDLAGTTLILTADSIRGAPGWIANVLRAGIATLALLLLWSLWALWRDHQHRTAAERLAQEEAAFRKAMGDCSVIGLTARAMDGRLTYVNPAFCRMVGYEASDLVGKAPAPHAWLPPLEAEYLRHLGQRTGASAPAPFEAQLVRRDGVAFPAAIYDAPLFDARGTQVGWTSSVVDLSLQKRSEERERVQEERLQTAARLTTMGELTSSLAHELNQPLGAIASYLAGSIRLLEQEARPGETEVIAALSKASDQTQRAGQVIKRIHEFVRKREPRRETVRLGEIVESCRALIELQAKREAIRVEMLVGDDRTVWADPVMLQQVVLNLTRNAIDAMKAAQAQRRRLVVSLATDASSATLSVRDFGAGIAPEDAERIFEPFFTTKAEGMGMGLSICRTIVQAHGGRLWFEPRDEGTEFLLWLPRAA